MTRVGFAIVIGWVCLGSAAGGDRALILPELEISGAAVPTTEDDAALPASAALDALPQVQWSPQGVGAQGDLSIRGSRFSGAGFSVSGLSLRNAQTEHFNAALPLPLGLFHDPQVLTGLTQASATTGHLVGSIGLQFRPLTSGGEITLGVGEAGSHLQRGLMQFRPHENLGFSLFGGRSEMAGFDYDDNYTERDQGGVHLQYVGDDDHIDLVGAYQQNDFGARGFYGVSPAFHSWESTEDLLLLGSWRHTLSGPDEYVRATAFTRRFRDDYLLERTSPTFYRNEHETRMSSLALDGVASFSESWGLTWRWFVEDERIDSSGIYLGSPTAGLGEHDRQRLGLMLLPDWHRGRWHLRAGGKAVFFTDAAPALLALAGIEYALADHHVWFADYTETVRQPSFTELDYESPASLGNSGLDNETQATLSTGLRSTWSERLESTFTLFYRETDNAVDWIRTRPGSRWLATDLGTVSTVGVEAESHFQATPALQLTTLYQYLDKRTEDIPFASRYAFNYADHRAVLGLRWTPRRWLEVGVDNEALRFADNPARGSDGYGLFTHLVLTLRDPRGAGLSASLHLRNLFDDDVQLYPGQPPAERHVLFTCSLRW